MTDLRIDIKPDFLQINDTEIKFSITPKKLVDIIGKPDRAIMNGSWKPAYNGTYLYDRFGLLVGFAYGKGSYLKLYYSLKSEMYFRSELITKNLFPGLLVINGSELPKIEHDRNLISKEFTKNYIKSLKSIPDVKEIPNFSSFVILSGTTRIVFQFKNDNKFKFENVEIFFKTR